MTYSTVPTVQNRLTRIEAVLDYIHCHLDESLSVVNLAEKSCWSRWQLQRIFGEETGLTVAQYVRELRLSQVAENLVSTNQRHLDIALACGFDSEISFSRAFKQMFACSPREYRNRGKRQGLRTPLQYREHAYTLPQDAKSFMQIRIESKEAFALSGVFDWINGPFSAAPNFLERVPKLWRTLELPLECDASSTNPIGVINTHDHAQNPGQLQYWAGYQGLNLGDHASIQVPAQEYAVIPVQGKVSALESAVSWFIRHWLPESNYNGITGYELEMYSPQYDPYSPSSYMEFWLPIAPR